MAVPSDDSAVHSGPPCYIHRLPHELLLEILSRLVPSPPKVPAHEVRDITASRAAAEKQCAILARLRLVCGQWNEICSSLADTVVLRFNARSGSSSLPTSPPPYKVRNVLLQIETHAATPVIVPDWLVDVVEPEVTLFVHYARPGKSTTGPPFSLWHQVRRCTFTEMVLECCEGDVLFGVVELDVPQFFGAKNKMLIQAVVSRVKAGGDNLKTLRLHNAIDLKRVPPLKVIALQLGVSGRYYHRSAADHFLEQVRNGHLLERLSTAAPASFNDAACELLPNLTNLSYLRIFRSGDTPASQNDSRFWSFWTLANKVVELLKRPDRAADLALHVEVVIGGTLRKYDVAQRTAVEALRMAMASMHEKEKALLTVDLLYHHPRPFRAFPLLAA
ncbi:F-box protein [Rhodotorula paludigena]|uniref:F-box protein n=1 Tax=Rhodotorula paludigena TaxID=86838 RepID=UPI00316B427F